MKKILLVLTLIIGFSVSAQELKFVEDTEITKHGLAKGYVSRVVDNFVVIEKEGTAAELYSNLMDYIQKTYTSPDEVIKSATPDEYIRIEGHGQVDKYFKGYYTIEFRVKDGKIKMSFLKFGNTINYFDGVMTRKKNGKIWKSMKDVVPAIEKYFNNMITAVKAHGEDNEMDF